MRSLSRNSTPACLTPNSAAIAWALDLPNLAVVSAFPCVLQRYAQSNMSDRAYHFLNDWFVGHMGPLPAGERLAASVRLAAQCRQDATAAGIPSQEIRDAVGGELIRKILQALDIAAALNHEVPLVPETSVLVES